MKNATLKIKSRIEGYTAYGKLGTPTKERDTNGTPLFIGDMVIVKLKNDYISPFNAIIVEKYKEAHVMGAVGNDFSEFEYIYRALPYDLVTNEITQHLHGMYIEEPKQMTISQIEKELGYSIEIVTEVN